MRRHRPNWDSTKIVVVGDHQNKNKSRVVNSLIGDWKEEDDSEFTNTFKSKNYQYDNRTVVLRFIDSTMKEAYNRLRILDYNDADMAIIVYTVSDKESFNNLSDQENLRYLRFRQSKPGWVTEVQTHLSGKPIILVGIIDKKARQVNEKEAREFAKKIKAKHFCEFEFKKDRQTKGLLKVILKTLDTTMPRKKKANNSSPIKKKAGSSPLIISAPTEFHKVGGYQQLVLQRHDLMMPLPNQQQLSIAPIPQQSNLPPPRPGHPPAAPHVWQSSNPPPHSIGGNPPPKPDGPPKPGGPPPSNWLQRLALPPLNLPPSSFGPKQQAQENPALKDLSDADKKVIQELRLTKEELALNSKFAPKPADTDSDEEESTTSTSPAPRGKYIDLINSAMQSFKAEPHSEYEKIIIPILKNAEHAKPSDRLSVAMIKYLGTFTRKPFLFRNLLDNIDVPDKITDIAIEFLVPNIPVRLQDDLYCLTKLINLKLNKDGMRENPITLDEFELTEIRPANRDATAIENYIEKNHPYIALITKLKSYLKQHGQLSDSISIYLDSFKDLPNLFSKQLNKDTVPKNLDSSGKVPNVPVMLHGKIHNLQDLIDLPARADGKRKIPGSNLWFSMLEINTAFKTQHALKECWQKAAEEKKITGKPLPTLPGKKGSWKGKGLFTIPEKEEKEENIIQTVPNTPGDDTTPHL